MILVDTSIWIDLLRTGRSGREAAVRIAENVTCGPILQEVLQGIDLEDAPAYGFHQALLALPRLEDPISVEIYLEAARIYRDGRRRGYTIRSGVDCVIAAIAIRHDVPVWHRDRDFDAIGRFTPLKVVRQIRR